jgi:DUF971 family protein
MATPIPVDIKVHTRSRLLEVSFDDGTQASLTHEFLRVHSPSAEVRGHGPGQEVLQLGKEAVAIDSVEPVGSYAVKFRFSDGHDTGIYTWELLYDLARDHDRLWTQYLDRCRAAGHPRSS